MQKQFENFSASELYCPRCKVARPVREKLLLVLPNGEIHACKCIVCGESLATREVKNRPNGIIPATQKQK